MKDVESTDVIQREKKKSQNVVAETVPFFGGRVANPQHNEVPRLGVESEL